jgi:hypothetical protein
VTIIVLLLMVCVLFMIYFKLDDLVDVLMYVHEVELDSSGESEECGETPDVPVMNVPEYTEPTSSDLEVWEKERASQRPSELTDYELARLERESEFDLRIARMKDELANAQPYVEKHGTIAYEAPGIQNLPHDIIPELNDDYLPDVEISQ